jgi:hypothetical protein
VRNAKFFDVQATRMAAQVGQLPLELFVAIDEDLERLSDAMVFERNVSLLDLPWIPIGREPTTLRTVRRSSDVRDY